MVVFSPHQEGRHPHLNIKLTLRLLFSSANNFQLKEKKNHTCVIILFYSSQITLKQNVFIIYDHIAFLTLSFILHVCVMQLIPSIASKCLSETKLSGISLSGTSSVIVVAVVVLLVAAAAAAVAVADDEFCSIIAAPES